MRMRVPSALLLVVLVASLVGHAAVAAPFQADRQFEISRERNVAEWDAQDRRLDERLAVLQRRYGRQPNIVYILADDIGWGELGAYGGGKVRGTPTPTLDALAAQGMKLLSHYSEPICTPTRVSLMTGRLPPRTGLDVVLFPGERKGLVAEEMTLAEILSQAGYSTGMFGKWHLGELDEHQPTRQGFDYAFYTLYNGGVWPWTENAAYYDDSNVTVGEIPYQRDMPRDYTRRFGIPMYGILESRKGGDIREVAPLSLERYNVHDNELTDHVISFIEDAARAGHPFFVYFATNANQVFACPVEERSQKYVDRGNCQAAQLAQHDKNVGRIIDGLDRLGLSENTLLVWMSDNGPMYSFFPSSGYSWLRGKKGDVYEGGIRTPAIVRWPGTILPRQDPLDLVHVTDWYTTAGRLAGALDRIPRDRVIDGIDQTPLLLLGEGAGRRDYMFHYERGSDPKDLRSGMRLGAVRYGDIKYHVNKGEYYNILRDPGEKMPSPDPYLWATVPFEQMIQRHYDLIKRFPNRAISPSLGPADLHVIRAK